MKFFIWIFIFVILTSHMPAPKVRYVSILKAPHTSSTIIRVDGKNYMVEWRLMGPDSVHESARDYRMSPDLMWQTITDTCKHQF